MTTTFPRTVGRYVIYDPIASGGMATIHLGRLVGPVGFSKVVAIKRLHEHLSGDPEFLGMFLDEARIAARISHPNVVSTLDIVELDDELFLVMEYVQGESLSYFIKHTRNHDTRIPPPIAAQIMVGVLHGLHAAHEAKNESGEPLGIVHRDVTPQNVLVGIDGVPRIADFGIASASGRLHHTREGQIKGKVQYMAPEQLMSKPMDRRGDIYAAGVVLWEALTGQRLFSANTDAQIMYKVLEAKPQKPSTLVPDLPPGLDDVLLKSLQRDPDSRYATAREMALALEATVPLVSPSTLASWVQENATESLKQTRLHIQNAERTSPSNRALAAAQLQADGRSKSVFPGAIAEASRETRPAAAESEAPPAAAAAPTAAAPTAAVPTAAVPTAAAPTAAAPTATAPAAAAAPKPAIAGASRPAAASRPAMAAAKPAPAATPASAAPAVPAKSAAPAATAATAATRPAATAATRPAAAAAPKPAAPPKPVAKPSATEAAARPAPPSPPEGAEASSASKTPSEPPSFAAFEEAAAAVASGSLVASSGQLPPPVVDPAGSPPIELFLEGSAAEVIEAMAAPPAPPAPAPSAPAPAPVVASASPQGGLPQVEWQPDASLSGSATDKERITLDAPTEGPPAPRGPAEDTRSVSGLTTDSGFLGAPAEALAPLRVDPDDDYVVPTRPPVHKKLVLGVVGGAALLLLLGVVTRSTGADSSAAATAPSASAVASPTATPAASSAPSALPSLVASAEPGVATSPGATAGDPKPDASARPATSADGKPGPGPGKPTKKRNKLYQRD